MKLFGDDYFREKYEALSQEGDNEARDEPVYRYSRRSFFLLSILCLILLMSNSLLLFQKAYGPSCMDRTLYTAQSRDIALPWTHEEDFNNKDHAITDHVWKNLNVDAGIVALSDEYAESMGLHTSQRFPWDDKKGIYHLNAYHGLHCLKLLYRSIAEARDGLPLSVSTEHNIHCLDALRQDVICNADDTPRYTGLDQPSGLSGVGQFRKCRDWSGLESWAKNHTACFRFLDKAHATADTLESYKFCPEGSPYLDWIHAIFGKED